MSKNEGKPAKGKGAGAQQAGLDPKAPATQPAQRAKDEDQDGTLDLGLDAIQSRLPYGSEDIADK